MGVNSSLRGQKFHKKLNEKVLSILFSMGWVLKEKVVIDWIIKTDF
jgi:hypothetical protein